MRRALPAYLHIVRGARAHTQFLISNRFNNAEEIRTVTCPTLIIHGEADQARAHRTAPRGPRADRACALCS